MNLAVNARDAMPEGGRLLIETQSVDLRETELRGVPGLASGRCAEIRVTDTGTGMPPETLDRVFEPFFTTKEVRPRNGPRAGDGLRHGEGRGRDRPGRVRARAWARPCACCSRAVTRRRAARSSKRAELRPPRGALNLLVVEDEDAVRRVLDRILTRHGHEVLTAAHPDEALAIVNDGAPIDMLITDVVMPGMSGPQLASRLTELQPGLPVLFISGYTDSPGELPAGATLLRKPFTSAALLREVAAGGSPPSP